MRLALLCAVFAMCLGAGCSNAPDAVTAARAPAAPESPAAPDVAHLGVWYWIGTTAAAQDVLVADPARYQIEFADAGTLLVQADCNKGSGSYALDGARFAPGPIALTKMGCPPDSQDLDFMSQLRTGGALMAAGGRLRIELGDGRGAMQFARDPKSKPTR